MADTTQRVRTPLRLKPSAWGASLVIIALVAAFDRAELWPTLTFASQALAGTAPFIIFAVLAVAYLKATGAETLLARAFEGNPPRMIVMAALLGGLSPFCSCEVIPRRLHPLARLSNGARWCGVRALTQGTRAAAMIYPSSVNRG